MGNSPTRAGMFFIPRIAFMSLGSVGAGWYMSRTGEYRKATSFCAGLLTLSMLGYVALTPTSNAFFVPCLLLDGFSVGFVLTTALIAMLNCVGPQGKDADHHIASNTNELNDYAEMATITSMSYLFRSVGGVIGISASSAIFQAVVKRLLTERITGPDADTVSVQIYRNMISNHCCTLVYRDCPSIYERDP